MLFTTDFQHFSKLITQLYSPKTIVDFPVHALSLLARLIDTEPTARERHAEVVSVPNRSAATALSPSIEPAIHHPSLARSDESIDKFPLFKRHLAQHQDTASKIADFSIGSDLHHLKGAYWRFLKPIDPEAQQGTIFADPTCSMTIHAFYFLQADAICLTVRRTIHTLTERDRLLLDSIRPHVMQAYHNAIAFTEIQTRQSYPDCRCGGRSSVGTVEQTRDESIRAFGLTKREFEVLCWLAKDKSNGEIAQLLKCSLGTVKKHLEHIYQKLDVQSRTAAVMRVLAQIGSIER